MILSPLPKVVFWDNNGRPLVGGKLFTYVAGTSTKIDTYTDEGGLSLNTNPVILDYRGEADVWLDPLLTYKFVLAPANATDPPTNPIWSVDDIQPGITYTELLEIITQEFIGEIFYPQTASEIAAGVTPVSYPYAPDGVNTLNVFRFYTPAQIASVLLGNLAEDVSAPLQAAINFLEGRLIPGTGGKPYDNGGTLYLPGGVHYCGTTSIRVGGNVRLVGNQYESTQLQWNNAFTGNCVTLGPDESDFYGYSGSYTMGTTMEHLTLQCSGAANAGILTLGVGQGCELKHLKLRGVTNIGISITDTFGNVGFKMSDIFILGVAGLMTADSVGIRLATQSVVEVERISIEGVADSAGDRFFRAVEIVSGSNFIKNLHFEVCQTGIDIDAATSQYNQSVEAMTATGLVAAGCIGIWVHAGYTGTLQCNGLTAASGALAVQNDNTGYVATGPCTVPTYTTAGTATDISIHENTILSGVKNEVTYVSGGTMTPDVGLGSSQRINVTTTNAFTIGAPTYNGSAMPSSLVGRRISIMIRNGGAGVMGAITWNGVFKMSAWTNPANNFSRTIDFEWNNTNWVQVGQTGVDVPN